MSSELRPRCSEVRTRLIWDTDRLAVQDGDLLVRLAPGVPQTLLRYSMGEVYGLAVLDADGLVLFDLPGDWPTGYANAFALNHGMASETRDFEDAKQLRVFMSARAPGFRRLTGLPDPHAVPPALWKRAVAVCVAAALVALIVYMPYGAWMGLRWIATHAWDFKGVGFMLTPLAFLGAHARRRPAGAVESRRGAPLRRTARPAARGPHAHPGGVHLAGPAGALRQCTMASMTSVAVGRSQGLFRTCARAISLLGCGQQLRLALPM